MPTDPLKKAQEGAGLLISIIIIIVILLIIYGLIKIFGPAGGLGGTGSNIGKTVSNVSGVASNLSSAANNVTADVANMLAQGNVPPGNPGDWNKLVTMTGNNPLVPSTWTGPTSDSTPGTTIAGFIANINNLPGNHWYDVFKLGEDLNDMLGGAPVQIIGTFAQMPSQTDIYQAVNGYNTQYSDDVYQGILTNLDSATQDSLASIILAKPITV
jgi:hypothetical protein